MLELKNGIVQCVESKPLPPLVTRFQLVLAEERMSLLLAALEVPRIRIEPAVVYLAGGQGQVHSHSRIRVGQYFTLDQSNDLNIEGDRLLTLNDESLFVTSSLKEKLEEAELEYLKFSKGLSEFAANAI